MRLHLRAPMTGRSWWTRDVWPKTIHKRSYWEEVTKRSTKFCRSKVDASHYAGTRIWGFLSSAIDSINRRARELRRWTGRLFWIAQFRGRLFGACRPPLTSEAGRLSNHLCTENRERNDKVILASQDCHQPGANQH